MSLLRQRESRESSSSSRVDGMNGFLDNLAKLVATLIAEVLVSTRSSDVQEAPALDTLGNPVVGIQSWSEQHHSLTL